MNIDDKAIRDLVEKIARQDERLIHLEKREDETREMITCFHKMSASVEALTQRVKENTDVIKASVAQQAARNDELRNHVNESVKDLRSEMDNRFKTQGERIGLLLKEPGEKAKKSWDAVKTAAITAVISVIVTGVAAYLLYAM